MASKTKRLKRWLTITASLLLLLITTITIYRFTLNKKIETHLQTLRDAGYPTTLAELDAWYPHPPQGQNAADLYLQAFEHLVSWPEEKSKHLPIIGDADLPVPGQPMTEKTKADIAAFLAENTKTLELLHQAAKMPQCRYPVKLNPPSNNPNDIKIPHITNIRHCSQLLALKSLLETHNNHPKKTAQAILDSLAVARSLKNEPLIVSLIVRIRCQEVSFSALSLALSDLSFSNEELSQLDATLFSMGREDDMKRAVAGDLCITSYYLRNSDLYEKIYLLGPPTFLYRYKFIYDAIHPIQLKLRSVLGGQDRDFILFLDLMSEYMTMLDLPLGDLIEPSKKFGEYTHDMMAKRPVPYMLLPSMLRAFEIYSYSKIQLLNVQIAMGIEQYRLAHNRLPEKLDDLVPQFLDAVPLDPFDGQPLRYKKLDKGYTVYSIGLDKTDNNGREKTPEEDINQAGTDIAFTVRR